MNHSNLRFSDPVTVDPRIADILFHARRAFVEKGFDGASMQDLARAAGMSAGNFYRYFPSKAAIVDAMVARDLDEVEREFSEISHAANPIEALRQRLCGRLSGVECADDHPLWAEILAAAARKPDVAAALRRMEDEICHRLSQIFALVAGSGPDGATERYGTHARLVFLLVRGAALENVNKSNPDSDLTALIMRTIDGLVDDIVQDASGEKI